jgi:hypothetical protein
MITLAAVVVILAFLPKVWKHWGEVIMVLFAWVLLIALILVLSALLAFGMVVLSEHVKPHMLDPLIFSVIRHVHGQ